MLLSAFDLSGQTPEWQTVDKVLKDPADIYHSHESTSDTHETENTGRILTRILSKHKLILLNAHRSIKPDFAAA